jgi:hypothetical protein
MALSTEAVGTDPIPSAAAALAVAGAVGTLVVGAGAAPAAPVGRPVGAADWMDPSWPEPSGAVGNVLSESRPVAPRKARMALSTGAVGTALALPGADGAAPAGTASEADAIDTSAAPGVVPGAADAIDGAAAGPATYSAEPTVG